MATPLQVPALEGRIVRLEPLGMEHVEGLARVGAGDRSTFDYIPVPRTLDEAHTAVVNLLALRDKGEWAPFAQVRRSDGAVMGTTSYLFIRRRSDAELPYAVEIGGTWLSPDVQRTGFNTEAKYLLMRHAFEALGVGRVDLKSDERNIRSRTAIERLGCTFEGILRHWQPSYVVGEETKLRSTAMYSVLDHEWPQIKVALETKLER